MGIFLVIILVAIVIAIPIGLIALRMNGNDNKPWPHMSEGDEHRWED